MLVEDVEVAVLRHVILKQAEAVGVDRADEHRTEPVEEVGPLTSATRFVMRSFSSLAARSVNVKATIDAGSAPSSMSAATRREIDSVFPEPAQAMT